MLPFHALSTGLPESHAASACSVCTNSPHGMYNIHSICHFIDNYFMNELFFEW